MHRVFNLLLLAALFGLLLLNDNQHIMFDLLSSLLDWLQQLPPVYWWCMLLGFVIYRLHDVLAPNFFYRTDEPDPAIASAPLKHTEQALDDELYRQLGKQLAQQWLWSRQLPERAFKELTDELPQEQQDKLQGILEPPTQAHPNLTAEDLSQLLQRINKDLAQ